MRYLYKITNLINSKVYIGQTINFKARLRSHVNRKKNLPISLAIQKYGKENFKFEVITTRHDDFIDTAEIIAIRYYNSLVPNGYNLAGGGRVNKIMHKTTRQKMSLSRKGKRVSEESKLKMSLAKKGKQPWLGRHHTEETKLKISLAKKGKKLSEETRKKLRQRTMSPENKRLLLIANTGKKRPKEIVAKIAKANTGKKRSKEVCEKISIAKRGIGHPHTESTRRKISIANTGKKRSKETCEKISKSKRGRPLKKTRQHV